EFAALTTLEVGPLALALPKAGRIIRGVRRRDRASHDLPERLRLGFSEALGDNRFASVLVTDVLIFYYAFFSWRQKPRTPNDGVAFSCHLSSDYAAIVTGFSFLLGIETFFAPLLIARVSTGLAWLATLLTSYFIIGLIGDFQRIRLVPVLLER